MLAAILALLQHEEAVEHAAEATGHTAAAEHEVPWLVETTNHYLGPVVLNIERAIMPPIYGLFGATWHEPAAGELIIPAHVVWAIALFIICVVLALLLRGKLSVDRPSKGQQLLEVAVETVRDLLDQVIGPYGRRYVPVIGSFALFILIANLMAQIPGLGAPTENINVTGALGITSFLYYIGSGFRQQGFKYLKHFTGGIVGRDAVCDGLADLHRRDFIQQRAARNVIAEAVRQYVRRRTDRPFVSHSRCAARSDIHDCAWRVRSLRADIHIHHAFDGLFVRDSPARRPRSRRAWTRPRSSGRSALINVILGEGMELAL